MGSVRLFFAAVPDPEPRARLRQAADSLQIATARAVPADQYHLTLLFLGAVDPVRLPAVRAVGMARRTCGFELRLDRWRHWREQSLLVAVPSEVPAQLTELRDALAHGVARVGVGFDARPFLPHVTALKKVAQAPVPSGPGVLVWRVDSFALVASQRQGSASVYTVVESWPLLDTPANG